MAAPETLNLIGGKYQTLELLGSGGMAEVYRARQLGAVDREVALKLIRPEYSGATDSVELLRE